MFNVTHCNTFQPIVTCLLWFLAYVGAKQHGAENLGKGYTWTLNAFFKDLFPINYFLY